jgi:hypothetical protein
VFEGVFDNKHRFKFSSTLLAPVCSVNNGATRILKSLCGNFLAQRCVNLTALNNLISCKCISNQNALKTPVKWLET